MIIMDTGKAANNCG